ncbi:MAG: endo-1,4-beta-xylanase [Treponema sp.]|nr:endo-1,4-beta-xylanase [Treponema sp.]
MFPKKDKVQAAVSDPYFREDPGDGIQRIPVYRFDIGSNFSVWRSWRTNDGRVLPNGASGFELTDNPFDNGSLIQLTIYFDPAVAGKSFGGVGMRAPINPSLTLNDQTFVEFDFYFPASSVSKYMRFEIWSTTSGGEGFQGHAGYAGRDKTQAYIRFTDMVSNANVDADRIGFHNGETWYKRTIYAVTPVQSGIWEYLNIDLHTETGVKIDGGKLMIGNIRITQADPNGVPIPDVVNANKYSDVTPIRSKYNEKNGSFLIGVSGKGRAELDQIRLYHYEIHTDENNLKPEMHERPPAWLIAKYPDFVFKPSNEGPEWLFPTDDYLYIRDFKNNGGNELHGHCLAWINQSPFWMRQIIPENISSMQWSRDGLFYIGSTNSVGPYKKVDKNTARRIYFDHVLCVMRHLMTTDKRYGSSEERGIIPFHSFDVLNVELHESRHSIIIKEDPGNWDLALRHISWLMAMTDNDFGDLKQHYVYLLFKYAHIAVPNAQMAERYKTFYNDPDVVPEYMKMDGHDNNGNIDSYVTEKPPILVFNDYEVTIMSKAKVAYNMIKELNTVWKTDPLYDGRNLIECLGIQGHEIVNASAVSKNQISVALFASLIDDGLLNSICFSEFDLRQPSYAPGGQALAPAVMNQKQADCLGYQYALFFKMFDKYKKYIDHVTIWSPFGESWMNSYLPFDHEQMAAQAYYAIMDPDRFIKGHSYLDEFYAGEYDKLSADYKPEIDI